MSRMFGSRSDVRVHRCSVHPVVGWNTVNSIALGFRSNDRAGPPPFGRQAGVPTPALKHPQLVIPSFGGLDHSMPVILASIILSLMLKEA